MSNENKYSYKILAEDSYGEYEEKKSKFLAYLHYASSEEEAVAFINSIKKKHYDARHNCSAMIIGDKKELVRSSDDGEPSGTAGKPMLEILLGSELTNVVAVVTRYFGGTLLGTGGLVRAYGSAIKDALNNSSIKQISYCQDLSICVSYSDAGAVEYYINNNNVTLLSTDYLENVTFNIRILKEKKESLTNDITQKLNGRGEIKLIKEGYFPI